MRILRSLPSCSIADAALPLLLLAHTLLALSFDAGDLLPRACLILLTLVLCIHWRTGPQTLAHKISQPILFWIYFTILGVQSLALVMVRYYGFGFANFDTGIFANEIATFARTGTYYSSILGMNGLGEHFTPNLILLAPFDRYFPSFVWIPLLKVFAFFSCALIMVRFSRHVLGTSSPYVYALPLAWTIHRYLESVLVMEFQPSTLGLPFVLLAFYLAHRERWVLLALDLIFLLGFKEHLPFIWVSVGIFLFVMQRRRALGLSVAISGICLGLFIYKVAMPYFAAGAPATHLGRFGPTALLTKKFLLLLSAVWSVCFLPLFDRRTLLFIVPAFGITLVSNQPIMITFGYHYQDIGLAVTFVGALFGLKQLSEGRSWTSRLPAPLRQIALLLLIVASAFYHTHFPAQRIRKQWPTPAQQTLFREVQSARPELLTVDQLWTMEHLGPHFYRHPDLHSLIDARAPLCAGKTLDTQCRVATSAEINPWPFSKKELLGITKRLDSSYSRDLRFSELGVYSSAGEARSESRK